MANTMESIIYIGLILCISTIHVAGSVAVTQTLLFAPEALISEEDVASYFALMLDWEGDNSYLFTSDAKYLVQESSIEVEVPESHRCLSRSKGSHTVTSCFWRRSEVTHLEDAYNLCHQDNGSLAYIADQDTLDWLNQEFPEIRTNQHWIGLVINGTDPTVDLAWVSGHPITWSAWSSTPPPGSSSTGPFRGVVTDEGRLLAVSSGTQHPFLCYSSDEIICSSGPTVVGVQIREVPLMTLGDTVSLQCIDGLTVSGRPGVYDVNVTCIVDPDDVTQGLPYPSDVSCQPPSCGPPPDALGAELMGFPPTDGSAVGEVLNYACKPGYSTLTIVPTVTCMRDYTWDTQQLELCKALGQCGHPPNVTGAILTSNATNRDPYSTATYHCEDGKWFSDLTVTVTSTCRVVPRGNKLFPFEWDIITDTCQVIQCGPPPAVAGANVDSTAVGEVGETRRYTCDSGLLFSTGNTSWTVTCSVTKDWITPPPSSCTEITCGQPPSSWNNRLPTAAVMALDVVIGQTVLYECQSGYTFPGYKVNKTLTCTDQGWNPRRAGTCERVGCGKPPYNLDLVLSYTFSQVGATAQYACAFDGYAFEDGSAIWTSECELNPNDGTRGRWTNIPNNCVPVSCPAEPPQHPGLSLTPPLQRRLGDFSVYTCGTTSHFRYGGRARAVVCGADGTWGQVDGKCEAKVCSSPPNVRNANLTEPAGTSNTMGSVARYSCEPGTRYITGLSHFHLTCQTSGSWTSPAGSCERFYCPPLPFLGNADASVTKVKHNTMYATAQCHTGHRFSDGQRKKSFTCNSGKDWVFGDGDYRCYRQTCSPLTLPHTKVNTSSIFYDTLAEVECEAGFRFEDGGSKTVLLCDSPGVWHGNYSSCINILCPSPPSITNATLQGGAGVTGYLGNLTFVCDGGLRFENGHTHAQIQCVGQDRWDKNISCSERCGPPPAVKKAFISSLDTNPGGMTSYTCHHGYRLADNQTEAGVTCNASSLSWPKTDLGCKLVHCPSLVGRPLTYVNTTLTSFGTDVRVWCDLGYSLSGTSALTATCTETGEWHPQPPPCTLTICGLVPEIRNGIVHGIYAASGHVVRVTCLEGFWIRPGVFEVNITCDPHGTWQQVPHKCREVRCPTIGRWDSLDPNTTDILPGTLVNVTCLSGTFAGSQDTWLLTECSRDGIWVPAIGNCTMDPIEPPPPQEAAWSNWIGAFAAAMTLSLYLVIVCSDVITLWAQFTGRQNPYKAKKNKK